MTSYVYPRSRYLAGLVLQDVMLLLALAILPILPPPPPLAYALAFALPAVLAWSFITLHFPSRIDVSDDAIAFHRYGRVHRFAWRDVERIRVRRFIVRDRVMIRIAPASAWRGRYWVLDSIDGFDALVKSLEARALKR
jgi:hypothetical protein